MTALAFDETTGVPWSKKCPRDRDNGPGAWHRSGNSDATRTLSRVPAASHSPFGAVQESNRRSTMSSTTHLTCDLCGEPIAEDDPRGTFQPFTVGKTTREAFTSCRRTLDYHAAPGRDCMSVVVAVLAQYAHQTVGVAQDPSGESPAPDHESYRRQSDEALAAWKATPRHERERIVMEALADDHLTASEAADRIQDAHPAFGNNVGYASVRALLHQLIDAGEVEREHGEPRRGRPVWRYFRRSRLEGPIADLDQQFGQDKL